MTESRITLATYITLSRFVLVPVFIYYFLTERYVYAVIILIICGLTDALDGFVARHFKQRSRLGSLLDPVADKFLMLVSYLVLSIKGYMPWSLTLLVVGRDVYIMSGALFLMALRIRLLYKPTRLSKLTTTLQILMLTFSFLEVLTQQENLLVFQRYGPYIHYAWEGLLYLTAIFTLTTFFQYSYIGYKFLRFGERRV